MRMVAILKNDDHPEYGEVSMPLPIKASEYSHCMELLSSLSIGDALNKDCKVEELTRAYPTLRCLEGCKVNIDELDYLAKRLDGFDAVEVSQFQAMADKLKLTDMKDLITKNITWVYLPASNCQIERAMKRAGITDPKDLSLRMGDSLFPMEIDVALDFPHEDKVRYVAIFEGTPLEPILPTEDESTGPAQFNWLAIAVPFGIVALVGAGTGAALFMKRRHETTEEESE